MVTPLFLLTYLTTLYHLHRFIPQGYYELDTASPHCGLTKYSTFNLPGLTPWEPGRDLVTTKALS